MPTPRITVDTHLFRELGELLVGRDSTALTELLKNAYDADATRVTVYAEALGDPARGFITISDDGNGMTPDQFESGFLRIAARSKQGRLSSHFGRRYTGEKGIGRLAAHKLAHRLEVVSMPRSRSEPGIQANIDWDLIEKATTLDEISNKAVEVKALARTRGQQHGTQVTLRNLRKKWTDVARVQFVTEVEAAEPPALLVSPFPLGFTDYDPLFKTPFVSDSDRRDPGMAISLEGDFAIGDSYWQTLIENTSWVIDVDASDADGAVRVRSLPTRRLTAEQPHARPTDTQWTMTSPENRPRFQARIFLRAGGASGSAARRQWMSRLTGVRVFMEGFRVLPYGESGNDWLWLDEDNTRRERRLYRLPLVDGLESEDVLGGALLDEGLYTLPNRQFFGGVFLTEAQAPGLRMLVNREGFIAGPEFESIQKVMRAAIDLNTRAREALRSQRAERALTSQLRQDVPGEDRQYSLDSVLRDRITAAAESLVNSASELKAGHSQAALISVQRATVALEDAQLAETELRSRRAMILVLASAGLQMAAFTHEIGSLVGTAQSLESGISGSIPKTVLTRLAREVREGLERQAAYLIDVVSANARRRRSRQPIAECLGAALSVVQSMIVARGITVINRVDPEMKSLPMFRSELVTVFLNLVTNAIKAAGEDGRISASGRVEETDRGEVVRVTIQNTGDRVALEESERWFRPFETTTVDLNPVLGQGMGLGLPITRELLGEYGGTVRFVTPRAPYTTAIEVALPTRRR